MMNELYGGMEGGPPVDLAWDDCPEDNVSDYLDMCYLGIKDNPKSFGFGVKLQSTSQAAMCSEFTQGTQTTKFNWYLDTNGNENDNCQADDYNISNQTGFEFKFKFEAQISSTSQNLSEVRVAYKCLNGNWVPTQIKLSSWTRKMCQDLEGAMIAVDKSDLKKFPALYNQSAVMRIYATSAGNETGGGGSPTTIASGSAASPDDTVGPGYYRPGTADFKFEDCNAPGQDLDGDGFTSENDPDCSEVKRKGYVDFEDCFPDGIDNDGNGLIDCDEPHCQFTPACSGDAFTFECDETDKQAPALVRYTVDRYRDLAIVKYDTDEPANGTLFFYGTDSQCSEENDTLYDLGDPSMEWDDYKPWHQNAVEDLDANTTYYFKVKPCDPCGKCGLSACLNFTTRTTATNLTISMSYTPSPGAVLTANVSAYVTDNNTGNYSSWNYQNYGYRTEKILDGKLKFDSPTASTYWAVELHGVDVLQSKTVNLSGAFIENTTENASGNYTYLGMEGANWQNLLQNLAVDVVKMTLPKPGSVNCTNMTLNHCNDEVENCTDVGNYTTPDLSACNDTHTVWTIPITLGFTTYGVSGGSLASTPAADGTYSLARGWNLISIPYTI